MHPPTLEGHLVRLEPLTPAHAAALAHAAAGADPALYRWTQVPRTLDEAARYIAAALAMQAAGTALPFATVRCSDDMVVGSTRLFNIERWAWPAEHLRYGRAEGDVAEIGYTWLSTSAIRSGINTEAKLLLLTHAFEQLQMLGVCLHTDARNLRSRAAMERIGARFDGILRAHRLATDLTARDSARYSFVITEWSAVKLQIEGLLRR
jgi:RimJ/RimL family protein N-acetyltransferase